VEVAARRALDRGIVGLQVLTEEDWGLALAEGPPAKLFQDCGHYNPGIDPLSGDACRSEVRGGRMVSTQKPVILLTQDQEHASGGTSASYPVGMSYSLCRGGLLLSTIAIFADTAARAEVPAEEKRKIETLIGRVESLTDAKFIRNGKEYTAANAARFLRGKWDYNSAEIHTARDFIVKAATSSSTTGQRYEIRFKNGREVACGDYLQAELERLSGKEKQ
jgi:hypothetical protein